ncbi:MAG: helix-turn-helix domain-containing protein [Bacteroidota bacterium]|nr:helix-turn-helix domain-containing protein [Bacteroidota bacterium]
MATIIPDTSNTLFRLAVELVNQSSRNIFLTGKAGTGKTTFLKYIRENCPKQLAVVAPTGVAAINAGGVTIHSFFQLPLSPFIPEARRFAKNNEGLVNPHGLTSRLRITKEKRKVLQQLELLIIDEISMVRCDIPDAIDTVLRYIRKRPHEKFGGVQVLFIGDMFQLPPVIKDPEWKELSEFYDSPYFFSSRVIREELPVNIEFNKIYRQSEERFIGVLNQVRNNELDEEGMKILESRYQPAFRRSEGDGYICLTTHNETARNTNAGELAKLNNPVFNYKAEIKGDFPGNSYPADEILQLKTGAQVMFIKNDADKSRRYFNGKIGVITQLGDDKIMVQCKDDPGEIEVSKEKWENIRYTLNKTSQQMEEEVLGSFIQYPLRLAWAITIHKSQGLTFEKAIIDAGEAFAPGQVYVALSRCTSLEGMILQSKIRPNSFFSDKRIVQFSKSCSSPDLLQQELDSARKHYQEKIVLETFDFRTALSSSRELQNYVADNAASFNNETASWVDELLDNVNKLQDTAGKFHGWLQVQFKLPGSVEENTTLLERTTRAAEHFVKELSGQIDFLRQSPAITDSWLHAKEYNESLNEIFAELSAKKFLIQGFDGNFDPGAWHKRKKSFVLPPFATNAYAGAVVSPQRTESPHPRLHQQLRKLRDAICLKKDVPIYIIAGSKTIDEMARYLPQTLGELRKISGFGDAKIEQYGQQFLEVILEYCKENGLSSLVQEKLLKRERKQSNGEKKAKIDTKAESFRFYKQGMSVTEIAKARNLAIQTIEGHLAHYVSIGEIKIEELVSPGKIVLIQPAIKNFQGGPVTLIKEKLGNDISYGEIRLVLASQEFQRSLAAGE